MTLQVIRGQADRTEAVYHTPTSNFNLTNSGCTGLFRYFISPAYKSHYLDRKSVIGLIAGRKLRWGRDPLLSGSALAIRVLGENACTIKGFYGFSELRIIGKVNLITSLRTICSGHNFATHLAANVVHARA